MLEGKDFGYTYWDDPDNEGGYRGYNKDGSGACGKRNWEADYTDLMRVFEPKRVVDIGCGKGYLLRKFFDKGCTVYGYDISEYAFEHSAFDDIDVKSDVLKVADIRTFEEYEKADIYICDGVLQYLTEDEIDAFISRVSKRCFVLLLKDTHFDAHEVENEYDPLRVTTQGLMWWVHKMSKMFEFRGYVRRYAIYARRFTFTELHTIYKNGFWYDGLKVTRLKFAQQMNSRLIKNVPSKYLKYVEDIVSSGKMEVKILNPTEFNGRADKARMIELAADRFSNATEEFEIFVDWLLSRWNLRILEIFYEGELLITQYDLDFPDFMVGMWARITRDGYKHNIGHVANLISHEHYGRPYMFGDNEKYLVYYGVKIPEKILRGV